MEFILQLKWYLAATKLWEPLWDFYYRPPKNKNKKLFNSISLHGSTHGHAQMVFQAGRQESIVYCTALGTSMLCGKSCNLHEWYYICHIFVYSGFFACMLVFCCVSLCPSRLLAGSTSHWEWHFDLEKGKSAILFISVISYSLSTLWTKESLKDFSFFSPGCVEKVLLKFNGSMDKLTSTLFKAF